MSEIPAVVGPLLGLRERQKQRRRQRIAEEALLLFDRQGFAETTIAQIAEEAEVSARTVSSYFPVKEELVFPDRREWLNRMKLHLANRPQGMTALESLRDWVDITFDESGHNREFFVIRHRIVEADPGLRAFQQVMTAEATEILRGEIAQDLGVSPEDPRPRVAAAATLAVFEVLGSEIRNPGDTGDLLDRALLFIAGGLAAMGEE